jgi:hypothetical protein
VFVNERLNSATLDAPIFYNLTISARSFLFGDLPINSTETGTLEGAQEHFYSSFDQNSTDPFIVVEANDTTLRLRTWNNTLCRGGPTTTTNRQFFFCTTGARAVPRNGTAIGIKSSNLTAVTPYELTSTSYPLDSTLRNFWTNTSDAIIVDFNLSAPFGTLEWENLHEGFRIDVFALDNLTDRNITEVSLTITAYDDCNVTTSKLTCTFNDTDPLCSFGTATRGFPGGFSGTWIRLLLELSGVPANETGVLSFEFEYVTGGNCRPIDNASTRFCNESINDTQLYNFASDADIDEADKLAEEEYNSSLAYFNSSALDENCTAALKLYACQFRFRPCGEAFSVSVKTCDGDLCATVKACGAEQCFNSNCNESVSCGATSVLAAEAQRTSSASRLIPLATLFSMLFWMLL